MSLMRLRKLPVWLAPLCLAAGAIARAQPALNPPAPLASPGAQTVSPVRSSLMLAAAQRAQEFGFPSLAADLYRQLLAAPGADRGALSLALVTALLDDGQVELAEKVLEESDGPHGSAWHLREGLVAIQLKKVEAARAELAVVRQEELPPGDRAWVYFLQGALFDLGAVQDVPKANENYVRAEQTAINETARARF